MFNFELLIELIKKAQGERSLNQFAQQCDIDAGNLSRIINNKNKQPPKPDTLRKIANNAYNGVSYEELMDAAGHLDLPSENSSTKKEALTSLEEEKEIERKIEHLSEELINSSEGLMLSGKPVSPEALESILEALSYGIRQAKIINKSYNPKK